MLLFLGSYVVKKIYVFFYSLKTMKPTAFKIACVLGILLLACAIVLMFINPQPQNNLPKEFFTPIIAFEFIQSPVEVKHFLLMVVRILKHRISEMPGQLR